MSLTFLWKMVNEYRVTENKQKKNQISCIQLFYHGFFQFSLVKKILLSLFTFLSFLEDLGQVWIRLTAGKINNWLIEISLSLSLSTAILVHCSFLFHSLSFCDVLLSLILSLSLWFCFVPHSLSLSLSLWSFLVLISLSFYYCSLCSPLSLPDCSSYSLYLYMTILCSFLWMFCIPSLYDCFLLLSFSLWLFSIPFFPFLWLFLVTLSLFFVPLSLSLRLFGFPSLSLVLVFYHFHFFSSLYLFPVPFSSALSVSVPSPFLFHFLYFCFVSFSPLPPLSLCSACFPFFLCALSISLY